ncbi:MAG: hypothetical protein J0M33_02660 [Anaerolineae bacterium]|nr:hypothetical protein [Anaerolineae bacterium]
MTDAEHDAAIAVLTAVTDHKLLAGWAADCAERVLLSFETVAAEDLRPRAAIAAARAWIHGELKMTDARKAAFAAHTAARDVNTTGAIAAARACGHAAATAHVAEHAIQAARYAVASARASAAAGDEGVVSKRESEWQYQHLLALRSQL